MRLYSNSSWATTNHSARNIDYIVYYRCANPRETRFGNGTQVKPCRSGLRTGWVTYREHRRKGLYVVPSFLLLILCVLCGVIVKSVLKSILTLFRPPNLERNKNKAQMWQCSSTENYYTSDRGTEPKLCTR